MCSYDKLGPLGPITVLPPRFENRPFSSQMRSPPAGWPCHRQPPSAHECKRWLCIRPIGATCFLVASMVRKFSTSVCPISRGCQNHDDCGPPTTQTPWPIRHTHSRFVGRSAGSEPFRAPAEQLDGPGRYPSHVCWICCTRSCIQHDALLSWFQTLH